MVTGRRPSTRTTRRRSRWSSPGTRFTNARDRRARPGGLELITSARWRRTRETKARARARSGAGLAERRASARASRMCHRAARCSSQPSEPRLRQAIAQRAFDVKAVLGTDSMAPPSPGSAETRATRVPMIIITSAAVGAWLSSATVSALAGLVRVLHNGEVTLTGSAHPHRRSHVSSPRRRSWRCTRCTLRRVIRPNTVKALQLATDLKRVTIAALAAYGSPRHRGARDPHRALPSVHRSRQRLLGRLLRVHDRDRGFDRRVRLSPPPAQARRPGDQARPGCICVSCGHELPSAFPARPCSCACEHRASIPTPIIAATPPVSGPYRGQTSRRTTGPTSVPAAATGAPRRACARNCDVRRERALRSLL